MRARIPADFHPYKRRDELCEQLRCEVGEETRQPGLLQPSEARKVLAATETTNAIQFVVHDRSCEELVPGSWSKRYRLSVL